MSDPSPPRRILQFGVFQCDVSAGELHKNGIKVKLSDQPFRLLVLLLERQGEMVSRRELCERLWPAGTFVEFEDGLNTAVRKLRVALDDTSENPRFLETVPRRGYRFMAPVKEVGQYGESAGKQGLDETRAEHGSTAGGEAAERSDRAARNEQGGQWFRWWSSSVAVAAAVGFALWWSTPLPAPHVTSIQQITTSARIDTPVKPVVEGAHVYYIERDGGHWELMESPVSGGREQRVDFPARNAMVMDASANSKLLVGSFASRDAVPELWSMPEEGGVAKRLGNVTASSAAYSPDGSEIAYAVNGALWLMSSNGSNARRIANLPHHVAWLRWSPGGRNLRFTVGELFDDAPTSLWEISRDGTNLHRLLKGWRGGKDPCCGSWTPDGRYYVFTAYHHARSNLWALCEKGSWWRRSPRGPFQLTFGPDSPWGGVPDADGRAVFFYNGVWREDLERLDSKTGQLMPAGTPSGAVNASYSRDGKWIAYTDLRSHVLFRSRVDGSERIQLAGPKFSPATPRWSPDGKWIVFGGRLPGEHRTSFVVPSGGGIPKPLVPNTELRDADWSGDGKSLVASQDPGSGNAVRRLLLIDFATRRVVKMRGSEGLAASRWSPDGRFISATSEDQTKLKLWDAARHTWSVIAHGTALGISVWSPDARYVYFQDLLGKGEALWRYDVRTGRAEKAGDFSVTLREGADRCALDGMTPDGMPVIALNRGALDLFFATVTFP